MRVCALKRKPLNSSMWSEACRKLMQSSRLLRVAGFLATFFICTHALAENTTLLERVGSVFDSIADGLRRVGENTEKLIEPRLGPLKEAGIMDFSDLATATRAVDRSFPVDATATVSVSNEFGEIQIEGWDQNVVQIRASITAGSHTDDEARKAAEKIDVTTSAGTNHVTILTVYPGPETLGRLPVRVDYVINVPIAATVLAKNNFGDIVVHKTTGPTTIDSRYGIVELADLGGPVTVQARGDLPVTVSDARNGANLTLQRAPATLARVAGKINVSSFAGPVEFRDLAPQCDADVTTEGGDIKLFYKGGAIPNIDAEAFFSTVNADGGIHVNTRGNVSMADYANAGSQVHLRLRSSFNPITIAQEPAQGASESATPPASPTDLVQGQLGERSLPVTQGVEVEINAMIGDVEIVGWDEDRIAVSATQSAHVESIERAAEAIESLALTIDSSPALISVKSQVVGDLAALGCTWYRMDLKISCPRTSPLRIDAASGKTTLTGFAGPVRIVQTEGGISASHVKGAMELNAHRGDVVADNTGGPLTITALHGGATTTNVYGAQTIAANGGKIVVDAPHGELKANNSGGDIRVIALEGIFGNTELSTERGNISMVVAPTSDASFFVTVENGSVVPALPTLSGSVKKNVQEYQGSLNNGLHSVVLRVKDGKIVID
jgi:hypothetical protein